MIIKKNDIAPERPVILVIYGQPGCGKTSAAVTAENPLLIDTDRGYDRACLRVDTLEAMNWQDIDREREAMRGYKTIVVDTAKAMLDDYLSAWAVERNYKLATNSLKRFGQMADDFKAFVAYLRQGGADIIFVCHDKETQEGDVIKHSPDCTGQSKDLLLRISDQVGYISKVNGRRVITFEPMDNFTGKNVAALPPTEIPDSSDPAFTAFMAGIIGRVRKAIQEKSEARREANETLARLREMLSATRAEEEAARLVEESAALPEPMKRPFFEEMKRELAARGMAYDKASRRFTLNDREDEAAGEGDAA